MIASSGMRLLELYPRQNPNGSLAKMLKALLTSKTAWCSDRSTMTWKAKVSKRKVLLYQLAVKVHGIKENVSGSLGAMYPTPNTQDHKTNPGEDLENWKKRAKEKKKQGINLQFALRQAVQMYPTPTQDSASERTKKYKQGGMPLTTFINKGKKTGGKLNPTFVEFLMGYPMNWTKIEPIELNHSETQSFHKSQEKLD